MQLPSHVCVCVCPRAVRRWCLFEWSLFLLHRPPSNLHVCAGLFLRPDSAPHYAAAIRAISVAGTHCAVAEQKKVLRSLIHANFVSDAGFER